VTAFTIILPTTADRGPVLRLAVRSVQLQSVADWELFIMGDGVSPETREVIHELSASDSRIRFFDHPKHERRGEIHRHQALREARGANVAYLCDRDLWFSDHLESAQQLLAAADFCHTVALDVPPEGFPLLGVRCRLQFPKDRNTILRLGGGPIPLSTTAHRLEAYWRLPRGWHTTPAGQATDQYMLLQWLAERWCRAASGRHPTVLWLHRGSHPGWPTAKRHAELLHWAELMEERQWQVRYRDQFCRGSFTRIRYGLASWMWWRRRRNGLILNSPAVRPVKRMVKRMMGRAP
jgi:glycosyltransferase involved in cell wall biosynthesis